MLKQVIDTFEILDSPEANGEVVKQLIEANGETNVEVKTVEGHAD